MAAINFPTATSNGQTFTADTGVIYTYIGTPPNGFWSGTFATQGLTTLDGRYIAKNDGNTRQTIQTQGLKFNNGTSDTILIDAVNSKIGIGTTSPASTLHINGSSDQAVTIQSATTGADSRINFRNSGGTDAGSIYYKHNGNSLLFNVGGSNTERMRIDSSGRVGINTTSFADSATALVVKNGSANNEHTFIDMICDTNESARIRFSEDGSTFPGELRYTTLDHNLLFTVNSSERMRIDSSGRLLVGLTSSSNKFHVKETNTNTIVGVLEGSAAYAYQSLQASGTTAGAVRIGANANNFVVNAGSVERLRIDSSGRLLIGTTTEGNAFADNLTVEDSGNCGLTLRSGTSNYGSIYFSDGTSGADEYKGQLEYNHSTDTLSIYTAGSLAMRIDNSGKIQYNHNTYLTAKDSAGSGYVELLKANASNQTVIANNKNAGIVFVNTNTSELARIDSSGNLGLGQTSLPATGFNKVLRVKPASGAAGIFVESSDSAQYFGLFGGTSASDSAAVLFPGAGSLRFGTTSGVGTPGWSEKMRIDSSGKVGIGSTSPDGTLHVHTNSAGSVNASTAADDLVVENNGDCGITILTATGNNNSAIFFGTPNDSVGAAIRWNDNANQMMIGPDKSGAKLRFNYGDGAEAMTIDSSGRVGIGISSPVQTLDLFSSGYTGIGFKSSRTTAADNIGGPVWRNSSDQEKAFIQSTVDGQLKFGAGGATERMRINSSGYVLVGKTTSNMANAGVEIRPSGEIALTRAGDLLTTRRVTTEGTHLSFRNISGTAVGNIVTTSSATAYNTSSDYRLKENVELLTGAIPRIKLLPVKRFNFIGNDVTVDGFMAHEAAVVVPESVTGTHNEVDGDGNPVYQSIDQAKLVPLLTAALQEAISRIETLETEVAALKAAS